MLIATAVGRAHAAVAAGRRVEVVEGPSTITREWGQRRHRGHVQRPRPRPGQLRRRGPAEASRREVTLPAGRYHIEWGGQFENLRARPAAAADRRAAGAAC